MQKRGDGPSNALREEALPADQIYTIWKKTRNRYGSPRITAQLWRKRIVVSEKKVARIMAAIAITGICGPKKTCTTRRDPSKLPSPDLAEANFTAERLEKLLVGDITGIPTDEGELFLASVIDVFTRRLLGWSPRVTCGPSSASTRSRPLAFRAGQAASPVRYSTPMKPSFALSRGIAS